MSAQTPSLRRSKSSAPPIENLFSQVVPCQNGGDGPRQRRCGSKPPQRRGNTSAPPIENLFSWVAPWRNVPLGRQRQLEIATAAAPAHRNTIDARPKPAASRPRNHTRERLPITRSRRLIVHFKSPGYRDSGASDGSPNRGCMDSSCRIKVRIFFSAVGKYQNWRCRGWSPEGVKAV